MSSTPDEPFVAKLTHQTGEREFLAKVLRRAGDELENGSTESEPEQRADEPGMGVDAAIEMLLKADDPVTAAIDAVAAGRVKKEKVLEALEQLGAPEEDREKVALDDPDAGDDERNEPEELHPTDDGLAQRADPLSESLGVSDVERRRAEIRSDLRERGFEGTEEQVLRRLARERREERMVDPSDDAMGDVEHRAGRETDDTPLSESLDGLAGGPADEEPSDGDRLSENLPGGR